MELPVILSDSIGCLDAMVPGVTGLQVPVGEVRQLEEAIDTYATSPERRRAFGLAGRHWVKNTFEPKRIWQAQQELYVRLLESAE